MRELDSREGTLYRIAFHLAAPDSRIALGEQADLTPADFVAIRKRLERMDRWGAWTLGVLGLSQTGPARGRLIWHR
jgi:hypothetical protein